MCSLGAGVSRVKPLPADRSPRSGTHNARCTVQAGYFYPARARGLKEVARCLWSEGQPGKCRCCRVEGIVGIKSASKYSRQDGHSGD
jgi:hypothetical protein